MQKLWQGFFYIQRIDEINPNLSPKEVKARRIAKHLSKGAMIISPVWIILLILIVATSIIDASSRNAMFKIFHYGAFLPLRYILYQIFYWPSKILIGSDKNSD